MNAVQVEHLIGVLVPPLTREERSMLLGRNSSGRQGADDLGLGRYLPAPPPPDEDATLLSPGKSVVREMLRMPERRTNRNRGAT